MKPVHSYALVALGLGLLLTLWWGTFWLPEPVPAHADAPAASVVPATLTRRHAPVVVPGARLDRLAGTDREDIFVYAHRDATWVQIPFQIDERDANGTYVPLEDGLLDDDDELVFMALDGGDRVAYPSLDVGGTTISATYLLTITDPISDTHAWAYVFHSAALSRTSTADYVSYDSGNDRIHSSGVYAFGFHPTYAFADYLTLGNSNVNLLDRMKVRGEARITFPPMTITFDEENSMKDAVHVVDGPVRVTRVSTTTFEVGSFYDDQFTSTLFAYQSLIVQPEAVDIPSNPQVTHLRTSMDWNEHAVGTTYYDANNPAGVIIDGNLDTITTTPPTGWGQVTGVTGTVVLVSDIPAGLGGTQSTYYKDDDTLDGNDTGDQRSFGDGGFQVDNPNSGQHTTVGHTCVLTDAQPNVGAIYMSYYENPVQVDVEPICIPLIGVVISGPATGTIGSVCHFQALISPTDALEPIAYTWTPTPDAGQGTANSTYTWTTAGWQYITVTASNCANAVFNDHAIQILEEDWWYLYLPLMMRDQLWVLRLDTVDNSRNLPGRL